MENQRKQCKGVNRELGLLNDIILIKIHATFYTRQVWISLGLSESLERENSGPILKTIPLLRVSLLMLLLFVFSKEDAALSKAILSCSFDFHLQKVKLYEAFWWYTDQHLTKARISSVKRIPTSLPS